MYYQLCGSNIFVDKTWFNHNRFLPFQQGLSRRTSAGLGDVFNLCIGHRHLLCRLALTPVGCHRSGFFQCSLVGVLLAALATQNHVRARITMSVKPKVVLRRQFVGEYIVFLVVSPRPNRPSARRTIAPGMGALPRLVSLLHCSGSLVLEPIAQCHIIAPSIRLNRRHPRFELAALFV